LQITRSTCSNICVSINYCIVYYNTGKVVAVVLVVSNSNSGSLNGIVSSVGNRCSSVSCSVNCNNV